MFGLIGYFPEVFQLLNILHITPGWALWLYGENDILDRKNSTVKAPETGHVQMYQKPTLIKWLEQGEHDMELGCFQESSPEYSLCYLTMLACACAIAQPCPTLCSPTDCGQPGSSVHGIFPGKNTGVGCPLLLQGIFSTQGLNPHLFRLLTMLSYLKRLSFTECTCVWM